MTFDELVQHGRDSGGGNIVNGMPWSFDVQGFHVTHENDNCYLICDATSTHRFERGDTLIIADGKIVIDKGSTQA